MLTFLNSGSQLFGQAFEMEPAIPVSTLVHFWKRIYVQAFSSNSLDLQGYTESFMSGLEMI